MQNQQCARWVDVLFSRLHVRYGSAWLAKWDGIDAMAVKLDWQRELAPVFERNPKAIAYALDHLPEFPPSVDRFKALCTQAPPAHNALPAPASPPPDKAFADAVASRIASTMPAGTPAAICAAKLRTFEARTGRKLSPAQRHVLESCERMLGGQAPIEAA